MSGSAAIYYTEVNTICMVILLLCKGHLRHSSEKYSTANKIFSLLIWVTVLLCFSDLLAGLLRGQMFFGARVLIELSNLVYYEAMTVISFLWMLYVFVKLGVTKNLKREGWLWSLPLLLFTALAAANPFTHLLFTVDGNNLFHRNSATVLHWIVTWLYLIVPTAKVAAAILREKNRNKRRVLTPFLYFILAPIMAGITQMLFYGVTSSQAGMTISIVLISLTEQSSRIFSDSLTGLNNRHAFHEYIANGLQRRTNAELTVFMIDVNNFKYINDKFGHLVGDRALGNVADALRSVLYSTQSKLFACRYGGDEFLLASFDGGDGGEEPERMEEQIHRAFQTMNRERELPYELSVSVGRARGKIADYDDVSQLLRAADEAMYAEKKEFKNNRQSTADQALPAANRKT